MFLELDELAAAIIGRLDAAVESEAAADNLGAGGGHF